MNRYDRDFAADSPMKEASRSTGVAPEKSSMKSGHFGALSILLFVSTLATGLTSCSTPATLESPWAEEIQCLDCSVILVSIDTLRADHLGCYGYGRDVSPNIDAFRQDSVLFSTTIAQAPSTAPSHASILTGTNSQRHGVSFTHQSPLPPNLHTAAEIFSGEGFSTAAFVGGGQVSADFGFDRGFQVFAAVNTNFSDKVSVAFDWIDDASSGRFFLFLHTYEVHHPYTPEHDLLADLNRDYGGNLPDAISIALLKEINRSKTRIDPSDLQHIINTYDAEIRSMDRAFGQMIEQLKRRELYDRSIIVITSDHGEEFMEHGVVGWHSHSLFDELLRVPLIIKFPRSAGRGVTVTRQVRSIDLLPTLLAAMKLSPYNRLDGMSLLTSEAPEFAVSQTDRRNSVDSIRTNRWKLYGSRLFDLKTDPRELRDVASRHGRVTKLLQRELALATRGSARTTHPAVDLSEKTRDELEALGYFN